MHLPVLFPVFILDILLWETRQMNKNYYKSKVKGRFLNIWPVSYTYIVTCMAVNLMKHKSPLYNLLTTMPWKFLIKLPRACQIDFKIMVKIQKG